MDATTSRPAAGAAPVTPWGLGKGSERLPGAVAAIERGRRAGLHLGAQLYVSLAGARIADLAVGRLAPDGPPLTPDHLMLWLSSTKPVTAVAVAQLWERGLLALDDPVALHLPAFAQGGKESVTIRHLLTHTGGVRMLQLGWPELSWEAIVAKVCARKLEPGWVPGEKAGYHEASSWFVLGELVERLDGRSFSTYVREEIFLPLGMDDSWIGMPPERYRAVREAGRLAPMFDTAAEDGHRPATPHGWDAEPRVVRPSPGGNGHGPMRELGRFYEALAAGGAPPDAGPAGRILGPQTVEAVAARHRAGLFDHTFQHVLDWGLGVIVDSKQYGAETVPYAYGTRCSRRTFGHSGYRSSTAFADPVHHLVVALAFNGTPQADEHEHRVREVLDALYDDLDLGPPVAASRAGDAVGDDGGGPAREGSEGP